MSRDTEAHRLGPGELQDLHRLLLDHSPDPIFAFAPDGTYLYVNRAFAEGVQRSLDQILGRRIWDVFPPEEAAKRFAVLEAVFLSGTERVFEVRVPRSDADHYYVTTVTPIPGEDGHVSLVICSSKDITARKRAEMALSESEEINRVISGLTADYSFVVEVRTEGAMELRWASSNLDQITGRSLEESATPDHWRSIIHAEDHPRFFAFVQHTLESGESGSIECRSLVREGRTRWIQIFVKPQADPAGRVHKIFGAVKEISERKWAEEEQERLQAQLLQAQKMESVGRLAGGVAHDFNNMLQAITGYTELALTQVTPGQPLHTSLEQIRKTARRSADLTRQLLAFARKQPVVPRDLDLNEVVTGTLSMLRRLIGEDIELAWHPGPDLGVLRMDPIQIDQVLANLCVNARDAIQGVGRITIETARKSFDEAHCALHPECLPGDYAMLSLRDDGCGMPAEVLKHLFEPFFTTKGVGKGTGLGLATVYGIVQQNNGFIRVLSEAGKGTTFQIFLPRSARSLEAPGAESGAESAEAEPSRGLETVLVVEDEAVILEMCRIMLQRLGYRVLTTTSPREAMDLAEQHGGAIHLLLTDVILPEMNGRDLSRLLRDRHPSLKLLYMSGYTADVIDHQGILDEGIRFIQKPFSMRELASRVREALDRD